MEPMPKAYGITGGLASGKSTVSQFFKELGVPVISADEISREICEPGKPAFQKIKEVFGNDVFAADGTLNRKKLGEIIFSQPRERKRLEAITHPLMKTRIRQKIRDYFDKGAGLVMVEAALLYESGFAKEFHGVIAVSCTREQQIERACGRDGISKREAQQRIDAQLPLEKKVKEATFVIDNSKDLAQTRQQTVAIFEKIKRKKATQSPLWH